MKARILLILFFLVLLTSAFAGNTGKIAGTVTDSQTGEPLIGANVIVRGTKLGAATDEKGNYYILQVPPGTYEVMASYIGYHNKTFQNVDVKVDLTKRLNFLMESRAIEAPTLTVTAEEPLVQLDITSTRKTTSREEIQETPGFETTNDIFLLHGGSVVGSAPQMISLQGEQLQVRDTSVKNVHIRGGRGGEILFMVDGVPVTHPIYGGRDVLELNVVDVQGMELLTGAFNAEYGQAQSGVINITTRTGSDKYEGGIEYKTSELDNSYATQYTSFYLGGPEPLTRNLLPALGLKLPGTMTFFLSGSGNINDTPYNNFRKRDDFNVFGLKLGKEKQDNSQNLNAKLNWEISNQVNMVLSYHGSWKSWSNFEWLWKNYPNNTASYVRNNKNFNIRLNHTLSKSSFYNLNFAFLSVDYNGSLNGKRPSDFWRFYKHGIVYDYDNFMRLYTGAPDSIKSIIKSPTTDAYGFYDPLGFESIWRDDYTNTFTLKGDLTSQAHPDHLIKTGFEVQYNDIQYIDIQDGGVKLSNFGRYAFNNDPYFNPPIGPYKEFGQNRWIFNAFPVTGGVYIQDKFEKEALILNIGVRADWFLPGSSIRKDSWKTQWENATGLKADWSWIKYKFSPRFGISFPISEKMVVFFSYGHFNQLPELQFFYRDPYTGGFTGNPHLDYEQTILYEFGLTRQLFQNWAIDIKSYTKDISKQVETLQLQAALGLPVYLYDNRGYSRARGLEFELVKRYSHFSSGKLTYTVQWANGYSSSAFENYIRSRTDFPNPIRERRLQWDIRQQIVLQAMLSADDHQHLNLFGLKLPDKWNITVLSRFSSGDPYTPYTLDPAEAQKKENLNTGPQSLFTDLKLKKSFRLSGLEFSIFADIFNVFNRKNVVVDNPYYRWFNRLTGEPYKYGDVDPQLTLIDVYQQISWHKMVILMDPRQYQAGRHIKLGLRLDW